MRHKRLSRRRFLTHALQITAPFLLAGCDSLTETEWFPKILSKAEGVTQRVQRLLTPRRAMAREYTAAELSANFPANGNTEPTDATYQQLASNNFVAWHLEVSGGVEQPGQFSLAELRQFPARTQITRHDCVEGWSAIGKWKGVPLHEVLARVTPLPTARYVVLHCADADEDRIPYYESIDFDDAYHAQTILAYEMNDQPLDIAHGAPLRLRVERQLGYKMAKYIMRIELVESFAAIAGGKGGYWEDQGYEWYAGI